MDHEAKQAATVADIMGILAGDITPDRVRTALMLAYTRGYQAGLDAAQKVFVPEASNG